MHGTISYMASAGWMQIVNSHCQITDTVQMTEIGWVRGLACWFVVVVVVFFLFLLFVLLLLLSCECVGEGGGGGGSFGQSVSLSVFILAIFLLFKFVFIILCARNMVSIRKENKRV